MTQFTFNIEYVIPLLLAVIAFFLNRLIRQQDEYRIAQEKHEKVLLSHVEKTNLMLQGMQEMQKDHENRIRYLESRRNIRKSKPKEDDHESHS